MERNNRFTFSFYFLALQRVLGAPRLFFSELPVEMGFQKPFGFLLVSSLFYTAASLTHLHGRPWLGAAILLFNALAMPFITAGAGFMVMILTMGRQVTFERLFAVYAFSSGVVLLAAWIPLFVYVTEPWKWVLVGIGMIKGCGFKWTQAVMVIGLSVLIVVLFFWSLGTVIYRLKGGPA